jgi:hypothetical protein
MLVCVNRRALPTGRRRRIKILVASFDVPNPAGTKRATPQQAAPFVTGLESRSTSTYFDRLRDGFIADIDTIALAASALAASWRPLVGATVSVCNASNLVRADARLTPATAVDCSLPLALANFDGACSANRAMLAAGVACVVPTGRLPRAAIDAALAIEPPDAPFAAAQP